MGKQFGQLWRKYGFVETAISPYEIRPLNNLFKKGFKNNFKHYFNDVYYWFPYIVGATALIEWAHHANHESHRKNPKDFENDV